MAQGPRLSCAIVMPIPASAGKVAAFAFLTEPGRQASSKVGFAALKS